jgi:hypothetical protein
MKKSNIRAFLVALVGIAIMFMGTQITVNLNPGRSQTKSSGTYASAQVDTIKYTREAGLSGLSFEAHWKDSVNITNIVCRRVFDGVPNVVASADSLTTAADSSATAVSWIKTITLAPLAEQYWVIVTYATDAGALNQGVSTPNVVYGFERQYSRTNNY